MCMGIISNYVCVERVNLMRAGNTREHTGTFPMAARSRYFGASRKAAHRERSFITGNLISAPGKRRS